MTESAAVADPPATIVVRSTDDLVEILPYLLGFHPADSVVVVGLRCGQLRAVVRADLPARRETSSATAQLVDLAYRHGQDGAALVIYGRAADRLAWLPLVRAVETALSARRVPMHDALLVDGERWWSYSCADTDCCPRGGVATRPGRAGSPIAAAATAAGLVALADRRSVEASVEPAGGPWGPMVIAVRQAESRLAERVAADDGMAEWRAAIPSRFTRARHLAAEWRGSSDEAPGWLPEDDAADLLVALADVGIRDHCWRELDRLGPVTTLPLCRQLVRRAVPPYEAAPLFLLGWAAWRSGDGVLARIAAQRALAADPGYDAARLLVVALDHGVDPLGLPSLSSPRRPHVPGRVRR